MAEKHQIKFWRGSRASYNILANNGALDAWTRYSVKEGNGFYTEYFGSNQLSTQTGQLLPVKSIVESVEGLTPNPGDRYLVGTNEDGYTIVEYHAGKTGDVLSQEMTFDGKYGVRVTDRGLKNYVYVNGELRTYDDVNCGEF